jgi:glycosyltransferase involved in cell wall biosynthesis
MAARPKLIHVTTVDWSLFVLLAYQLERFADAGYEVIGASAPGEQVAGLERRGIRHAPIPALTRTWSPGRDARALAELRRLFRRERPAIVHTHNPKSGVLGRSAARAAGVPVIVNPVHGLYASPSLGSARRIAIGGAERFAARLSHAELFQSEEDLSYVLRSRLVSRERANWLGNGVDLRRFDPDALPASATRELRLTWGARPSSTVVGTVGRLVQEKGYREFFAAARSVRASHPDTVFVAVGPEEPDKSDRLTHEDLADARSAGVVMHGAGVDMPRIHAAFDVFVLASYREGMPRSAIEASAMRRPVVATDIRGSREVVADGVTGVLVPVGNADALAGAIRRLLQDRPIRDEMGAAGRRRALERFDEDAVVARTLSVYERLLARRGIAPPPGGGAP